MSFNAKVDHPAEAIYRPFFRAGILVVLTAGAVWGAYLLLRIAWTGSFRSAGLHEVNAHGHAQIFGWVGLFVMGFAYQVFPRFKGTTLAWPGLAWTSLGLMITGLIGRTFGEPLAGAWPLAGTIAVVSAWLEVAAIALLVAVVLATWRAAGKGLAFYDYYILAALGWFLTQAVLEALYLRATLVAASREELVALVATWQGALRDVQIHGFALLMILGVSQRGMHHFYGVAVPNRVVSLIGLVCINAAIVGETTALVLMRGPARGWAMLWYASILLLAVTVAVVVWNTGIFSRVLRSDRSLKFFRAAFSWLFLSLAMLVLLPAYQFAVLPALAPTSEAAELGFSHAYHGAIRHAITVGFISLMILGVAARIVPAANGVDTSRLTRLWAPFLLVNVGCALRVTSQTLTDFTPYAFPLAGVSGVFEVTGLALWGAHLWMIMAGQPRYRSDVTIGYVPGTPIEAGHRIGDVIARHPELRAVLLDLDLRPTSDEMSIGQACSLAGHNPGEVVATLNRARTAAPDSLRSLPMVSLL